MLTYLPATLPPVNVVEALNPKAAKAITRFHELEASMPPRRSAEQLNALDEARERAMVELTSEEFINSNDRQEVKLHAQLAEQLREISAEWNRLEQLRGLRKWRAYPQQFQAQPVQALTIAKGQGGYKQTLTGRELLSALQDAVEGGASRAV